MASTKEDALAGIKHIVLVLSGKGGVGKSTVSVQIASGLMLEGFKVGILDTDLCGPSIPRMLGVAGKEVHQCSQGWVPVYADDTQQLAVMSIGFLLKSDTEAVVWRGPKKTAMIKQFLSDVCWGELDYLIIDTPPGTSDEHLSIVEGLQNYPKTNIVAVLVTTPQGVSVADVRREANFCKTTGLPVLGVIENMSGFVCPTCSECSNLFSTGGGERLAEEHKLTFLGRIPIDPRLAVSLDSGVSFLQHFPTSTTYDAIKKIIGPLQRWGAPPTMLDSAPTTLDTVPFTLDTAPL